jgi:formylglycine-generating enzyme required for sulfatase activity
MEWITIPAGTFTMGSQLGEGNSEEYPQHTVYLDAYKIGKYEVTNRQFAAFVSATGYTSQGHWRNFHLDNINPDGYPDNYPNYPVVNVSWNDAKAFCDWAGYRLPTEAQWEKAARGRTDTRRYPWGDDWDASKCNNWNGPALPGKLNFSSRRGTLPGGSFPAGASPYGVMDMAGNVWEWCADWESNADYSKSPLKNPTGPARGIFKVVRGGSWRNFDSNYFRCAYRDYHGLFQHGFSYYIGFRCVR